MRSANWPRHADPAPARPRRRRAASSGWTPGCAARGPRGSALDRVGCPPCSRSATSASPTPVPPSWTAFDLDGRAGRDRRRGRPERRGQEHPAAPRLRPAGAAVRRGAASTASPSRASSRAAGAPGASPGVVAEADARFPYTVRDTVALGRHPWRGAFGRSRGRGRGRDRRRPCAAADLDGARRPPAAVAEQRRATAGRARPLPRPGRRPRAARRADRPPRPRAPPAHARRPRAPARASGRAVLAVLHDLNLAAPSRTGSCSAGRVAADGEARTVLRLRLAEVSASRWTCPAPGAAAPGRSPVAGPAGRTFVVMFWIASADDGARRIAVPRPPRGGAPCAVSQPSDARRHRRPAHGLLKRRLLRVVHPRSASFGRPAAPRAATRLGGCRPLPVPRRMPCLVSRRPPARGCGAGPAPRRVPRRAPQGRPHVRASTRTATRQVLHAPPRHPAPHRQHAARHSRRSSARSAPPTGSSAISEHCDRPAETEGIRRISVMPLDREALAEVEADLVLIDPMLHGREAGAGPRTAPSSCPSRAAVPRAPARHGGAAGRRPRHAEAAGGAARFRAGLDARASPRRRPGADRPASS